MTDQDLVAIDANLDEIAKLLPRVWDVLDSSTGSGRLIAVRDPNAQPPLCDEPKHRKAGIREPCIECRVEAEREGWKPPMGRVLVRPSVIDAAVEAELILRDLELRVFEHLTYRPGVFAWPQRLVTSVGRARRLQELMPDIDDPALIRRAAADTGSAAKVLSAAIDGESTTRLPAPCPHCLRSSLIVWHDDGVIRCSGQHVCFCSSEDCPCHRGKRHEWRRARGKGQHGEWDMLARLLAQGRSA